jgi:hypothetical protein
MSCGCTVLLLLNILPVFYRGKSRATAEKKAVSFDEMDHEEDLGRDFLGGPMGSMELAFQPEPRPRMLKTNISRITKYVTGRIAAMGFDVYVSYSGRSKSRYLDIMLSNGKKIVVRISDHPADCMKRWRCNFDIHTAIRRRGSVDYAEFLDAFKQIVGESRP